MVESPNAVASSLILDDPNASIGIGGVAGANLTVAHTLAIEEGSLGVGGARNARRCAHPHRCAEGQYDADHGMLWFPGSATINATVENDGTIKAEGAAGTRRFRKDRDRHGKRRHLRGRNLGIHEGGQRQRQLRRGRRNPRTVAAWEARPAASPALRRATQSAFTGPGISTALTNPTSGTTDLTLISGKGATHTFDFTGTYTQSDFTIASGHGHTTTITFGVTTKRERGSTCAARAGFSLRYPINVRLNLDRKRVRFDHNPNMGRAAKERRRRIPSPQSNWPTTHAFPR